MKYSTFHFISRSINRRETNSTPDRRIMYALIERSLLIDSYRICRLRPRFMTRHAMQNFPITLHFYVSTSLLPAVARASRKYFVSFPEREYFVTFARERPRQKSVWQILAIIFQTAMLLWIFKRLMYNMVWYFDIWWFQWSFDGSKWGKFNLYNIKWKF